MSHLCLYNLAMVGLADTRLDRKETEVNPRYDADWFRVLAFGFLILHHAALAFKPWGTYLLLIWNEGSFLGATQFVDILNIWAIPMLFVASGMGLLLAMEQRNWKQLVGDLAHRVFVPLAFGTFVVGPLSLAIAFGHYYGKAAYIPTPGHLWFLGNLLIYVSLLLPILIWVKRRPSNWLVRGFEHLVGAGRGLGVVLLIAPAVLEAVLMNPMDYTSYAFRLHGLVLGFICFLLGLLFVSSGETGKRSVERLRFGALALGCALTVNRLFDFWNPLSALLALESMSWIIAIWGFTSRHLGKPSKTLRYVSSAVFPVYVLHVPVQIFVSSFLMPLGIHAFPKFLLLVMLTLGGSIGLYEIIKRIPWIRSLLGMEWLPRNESLARQRETG